MAFSVPVLFFCIGDKNSGLFFHFGRPIFFFNSVSSFSAFVSFCFGIKKITFNFIARGCSPESSPPPQPVAAASDAAVVVAAAAVVVAAAEVDDLCAGTCS